LFERPYDTWPGFGEKFEKYGEYIEGPKYIRLWPHTLASEDEVRREGHMTLLRSEWLMHMMTYPRHLLVTCFVRASEQLGLFRPHHPLYRLFVRAVESVGII